MILLQCANISKSFGSETVLSNIKLEIHEKERIGLVGRNGAGKSTLLKIIAGELSYDEGELIIPKGVTIGYLAQDTGLDTDLTIWEEMLCVFNDLRKMEEELRALEEKMSSSGAHLDEKLLNEYDALHETFTRLGGYQYETNIRTVLSGLKFFEKDYDTKISTLSGGQKTRLALGKLLLTKPDLLVLDEPTNHLDIETLTWLEQYLTSYDGAILVVSHDRYFLDKIVTHIYELSHSSITKYKGNYSDYLIEKAKRFYAWQKQYEKQQKEIARLEEFIQRNIARAATSRRAQSRRKQLEKMTLIGRPQKDDKKATFSFTVEKQSGNDVLKADNVTIGYGDTPILKNVSLDIKRGESVALIGPNGIGKSTLLKTIAGELRPLSGSIQFGSNVTVAYYDQELAQLHANKTVLNELWDEHPEAREQEIRTVLGHFLFSGDDAEKLVSELSGGEKARLSLAKIMMKQANFLILDEPTNHLDLDSKEALEAALIDYPGTILFVSHDRYFLNRIATRVVEISSAGIANYLGDYDYYVGKKQEIEALKALEKIEKEEEEPKQERFMQEKEKKRKERKRQRKIEELEAQIEQWEKEIEELEERLYDEDVIQDYEKVYEIQKEIDERKQKIDKSLEEWEALH